MYRQKDRFSLIVCLTSVLELDRPVQAVTEDRRGGERWDFHCCRAPEQWKVIPTSGSGYVLGHNTGDHWSFYDTCSCAHIEVTGHHGVFRVWDYGGIHPVDVTFRDHTVTLCEPAAGHTEQFHVEA